MSKRFKLVCQWCSGDDSGEYDDELELSPTDDITSLTGEYDNIIVAMNHWSQVSYMTRDHDGNSVTGFIYDTWVNDKLVWTNHWGYTKRRDDFIKTMYTNRDEIVYGVMQNGVFEQYWISTEKYPDSTIEVLKRLGIFVEGVTTLVLVNTLGNLAYPDKTTFIPVPNENIV